MAKLRSNYEQTFWARFVRWMSGGSDYSIDLLKGAGVDMSAAEPIENAMQLFKELLDEFETL